MADTNMVNSKYFNDDGKYIPESERAAKWLDAARERMVKNKALFNGGNLSNSVTSGFRAGEFTQADLDLLVERNSYFWGNDEIEKIVFYVYVYNERSWPELDIEEELNKAIVEIHQEVDNLLEMVFKRLPIEEHSEYLALIKDHCANIFPGQSTQNSLSRISLTD